MNPSEVSSRLRRANPFIMLAVGLLVGSLVTAVAKSPGSGGSSGANSNGSIAAGPAAGGSAGSSEAAPAPGGVTAGGPASASTPSGAPSQAAGAAPATASGSGGSAAGAVSGSPTGPRAATASAVGGSGCAGSALSGVRGVTAKAVKIGFAIPDIKALSAVMGAQVDPGDMQAHIEAILAGMRKDHVLPVCGRDIQPVYRTYNVLDPSQSRAACVGFIQQDQVFAVIALFAFGAQDCVATENRTPLFDLVGSDATLRQTPYLFLTDPSIETGWRSMAYWLVKTGKVQGKTIGVYYNSNVTGFKQDLVDTLTRLGYPPKVTVVTDNTTTAADPNDAVAVQRFRTGGVNLAITTGGVNFYQQAKAQAYHPQWAVQGVTYASDATTGQYPPDIFDGAEALLFDHVGEVKAGFPLSPQEQTCYRYWDQAGHTTPNADYGEGQTIRESCDQINLFIRALGFVGNGLSTDTFVRGMEQIRNVPLAYYSDASFAPGKHYGSTKNVEERYSAGCGCWKSTNNWVPLYSQ